VENEAFDDESDGTARTGLPRISRAIQRRKMRAQRRVRATRGARWLFSVRSCLLFDVLSLLKEKKVQPGEMCPSFNCTGIPFARSGPLTWIDQWGEASRVSAATPSPPASKRSANRGNLLPSPGEWFSLRRIFRAKALP
jgi:hypothetical protein